MAKYDIANKSIIVTGAGGGIGSATARALVQKGAHVVLVDLSATTVDAVASTLPADSVLALSADVTDVEQMTGVVDAAVGRFGRVDVVFANAGIANDPPTTLAAANLESYEKVIEVDLLGVVRTIKPALPEIIRNSGYVLLTASLYAFVNGVINSAYAASKAGVEMLGRSLRVELASEGASAGVLYPGWVTTPITDAVRGHNDAVTQLKQRGFPGPFGKFIEPEQIANAVVAGIEARAARIIEPKRWAPVSAMRGVFNIFSDRHLARDQKGLALIRRIDAEARDANS
ncbi:MAG: SDR family NAD(P)-dependent oxidoreductase [Phycisphaerales bacterium]|nr:SDR family NAD(P)-dependent oxidoreductase [Phycisphaerales bacterium]